MSKVSVIFSALMAGANNYVYRPLGVVERWIDGDTFVAHVISLPGLGLYDQTIRVAEINTPEKNSPDPAERERARAALARAVELLPPGITFQMFTAKREKYGRLLAKVELPDGRDYGTVMVEEGHAVPYMTLKLTN